MNKEKMTHEAQISSHISQVRDLEYEADKTENEDPSRVVRMRIGNIALELSNTGIIGLDAWTHTAPSGMHRDGSHPDEDPDVSEYMSLDDLQEFIRQAKELLESQSPDDWDLEGEKELLADRAKSK